MHTVQQDSRTLAVLQIFVLAQQLDPMTGNHKSVDPIRLQEICRDALSGDELALRMAQMAYEFTAAVSGPIPGRTLLIA